MLKSGRACFAKSHAVRHSVVNVMNVGGTNHKISTSRQIARKGPGNKANERYEHLESTFAIFEADSDLSGTLPRQNGCTSLNQLVGPGCDL